LVPDRQGWPRLRETFTGIFASRSRDEWTKIFDGSDACVSPVITMHEAVEQYVGREEKREKLRLDALAAWNQYQTTGLHATAGEADAWLAKLEAGEDAEAPTAVHQSPSAETTNAKWPLPQEEATSRRVKNGK